MRSQREGNPPCPHGGPCFETRKPKPMVGKEIKIENSLNKMLQLEDMALKLLRDSNGEIKDKRGLLLPFRNPMPG